MAAPHAQRAAIASSQLEQLRSLVAELFPGNKFYSNKLQAVGVTFDIASLEDFSRRFPFTTKAELSADQLAHPPFGTDLTYPLDRYTRFHQTSGTTGAPLRWLDTPESWDWMLENWMQVYLAAGVNNTDRIYFAFTFGPFIGFWMAFEAGAKLGALCIPGGGMSSAARVRAILDNAATVLCCTPTYALRLAEVAAEEKIDLQKSRIRRIMVAGEPGGSVPAIRNRLEQLWPGAQVWDHHGMTETGPVTYQCPARPGVLHVIENSYYAEIVDPANGQLAAPGQPGELILTTLGRTGSPLLRYRTGDLVQADPAPCPCGSADLALLGGIIGRTDDMLVIRGVNIFPGAIEQIIHAADGIVEYQLRVTQSNSMTELNLHIEPAPDHPNPAAIADQLQKGFQTRFALRVPVHLMPPNSLPRFEMKAKRWLKQ